VIPPPPAVHRNRPVGNQDLADHPTGHGVSGRWFADRLTAQVEAHCEAIASKLVVGSAPPGVLWIGDGHTEGLEADTYVETGLLHHHLGPQARRPHLQAGRPGWRYGVVGNQHRGLSDGHQATPEPGWALVVDG
jgi:hypothetical protein